jgi:hypothetical protein
VAVVAGGMVEQHRPLRGCADCGAMPPMLKTNYTLISSLGWRVEAVVDESGRKMAVLRCPECAKRRKQNSALTGPNKPR